jgi:hypothetical protein
MLDLNKAYGVLHAISQTGTVEGAAALNGISAPTYYNWMRHGKRMTEWEAAGNRLEPEDEPFAILYRNVNQTLSHLEVRNFEIVQSAAQNGEWQRQCGLLSEGSRPDGAGEAHGTSRRRASRRRRSR